MADQVLVRSVAVSDEAASAIEGVGAFWGLSSDPSRVV